VLAFSYNSLEDVTQRYTQEWSIVQLRRRGRKKKNGAKVEEEFARIYSSL
jgi:hypothetical protein